MDEAPEQNGFNEFISWEAKSRDTIDFKTIYVDMAGDLMAGLMLSQIIYWYLPDKRGRTKLRVQKHGHLWLVKARTAWWSEIRLTARQADRALETLRDKGLITTSLHRFSGAPTTHIRLNKAAFLAAWNEAVANDYSNLPNGEFTKPLIQEGDNLPNGDMELPDPVNSLTETTAKTTVTESTILPAGAEIPPSQPEPSVTIIIPAHIDAIHRAELEEVLEAVRDPDAFPATDNPDSVSNGALEEVAPAPSEGDYMADVLQRQSAKASFTVPPAAGGADGAGEAMLEAWVAIKGYLLVDLPRDDRRKWPRQLGKLAEKHDLTVVQAVQAMKVVLDRDNKEFGYYTYTAPSVAKFKLDFGEVAMRIKGGGNGYKSTRAPPVKARTAADYEEGDKL